MKSAIDESNTNNEFDTVIFAPALMGQTLEIPPRWTSPSPSSF